VQNEEFKKAVGCFPTGVAVITTSNADKLWGFTANSFASVSLDPPLISFCLNKESASFTAFDNATTFAISVLSSDQSEISKHFAQKRMDKFANIDYKIGNFSKSPLITGAKCFLECKKYDQFECGDHYIFVGKVMSTNINEEKSPIVYFAKTYSSLDVTKR